MGEILPVPSFGDLFADSRGADRTMRVSYHQDRGTVVVSLWLGTVCRGSFRLAAGDVGRLISTLSEIRRSIESTPLSDSRPSGSAPDAGSPGGTPGTATPAGSGPAAAPVDQTGDVTDLANSIRLRSVPPLRVA